MLSLENRYLIKEGLSHPKNILFREMILKQSYSLTGSMGLSLDQTLEKLTPIGVAFYLVPMINALIRVGTMEEKELLFKAFIDGNVLVPCNKRGAKGTMERAAIEAIRICGNAKTHQNKIKDNAVEQLEYKIFKYDLLENKILFVRLEDEDDFPAELNGLIAMQLSAKYKKPTIVARLNDQGFDRGSARGLNKSELTDFKKFLTDSGYFEYAQGHANAFGVSIPDDNLSAFHKYANEALKNIDFGENQYDVDFMRDANAADLSELILTLGSNPSLWGQDTNEPLINVTNITVRTSDIKIMGKESDTVKIESNGIAFMKFKAKDFIEELQNHGDNFRLNVVGRANINTWGGRVTPQLFIDDYEFKKNSIVDF